MAINVEMGGAFGHFVFARAQVVGRPFDGVTLVGFVERDFHFDVGDVHPFERAGLAFRALAQADKDGVARIFGIDVLNVDARQIAAINRLQGNRRAVGIKNSQVAHGDLAETTVAPRPKLERIGTGAQGAVFDVDVLTTQRRIFGFEADRIVGRIDETIADAHVFGIGDVQAVVVPVGGALDRDAVDDQVRALPVVLHPIGGIFEGNPGDGNIAARFEIQYHGAAAGAFHLPDGVLHHFAAAQFFKNVQHQFLPLPVNDALATDADVVLVFGHDHGGAVIYFGVIVAVGRAEQAGTEFQVQGDASF